MKKFIALILTLLFTLSIISFDATAAFAKTPEEKAAAKEAKKLRKQMKKLLKAYKIENAATLQQWADDGDVQAQCILAYALTTGQRFKKNQPLAMSWQNKAAEQNIPLVKNFIPKQFGDKKVDLAVMFAVASYRSHEGLYVEQNFDDAVKWADLGAKELNSQALAYLGSAYYTGRGMVQNYEEAIKYFKLADEDPLALELLSDAYARGNGVEQNGDVSKFYASYLRLVRNPQLHKEELKAMRKYRKKIESGELTGIVH